MKQYMGQMLVLNTTTLAQYMVEEALTGVTFEQRARSPELRSVCP